MKHIHTLFDQRLAELSDLFIQASVKDSPALWLYQNNTRTTLFYLEAMCRALGNFHNKKRFEKLTNRFKALEDGLGQIDYYDTFIKEFSANKAIPNEALEYLSQQRQVALLKLNDVLIEDEWIGQSARRIQKIRYGKNSKKIDWLNDEQLIKKLHGFYADKISSISAELLKPMASVEQDLHELRRDVRWLSIYPQAFKGYIGLTKPRAVVAKKFDKYLTDEIVNSPYNKLPANANIAAPLLLNTNNFYAMSWFIDAAGKLKDQGLRLDALTHAIHMSLKISPEAAQTQAIQLLGHQQATTAEILASAQFIAKQVSVDGIFTNLLVALPIQKK